MNKKGIGLGLNISQKIVTSLGGKIAVESVYGEGTEFKFAIQINQTSYKVQKPSEYRLGDSLSENTLVFDWKPKNKIHKRVSYINHLFDYNLDGDKSDRDLEFSLNSSVRGEGVLNKNNSICDLMDIDDIKIEPNIKECK